MVHRRYSHAVLTGEAQETNGELRPTKVTFSCAFQSGGSDQARCTGWWLAIIVNAGRKLHTRGGGGNLGRFRQQSRDAYESLGFSGQHRELVFGGHKALDGPRNPLLADEFRRCKVHESTVRTALIESPRLLWTHSSRLVWRRSNSTGESRSVCP